MVDRISNWRWLGFKNLIAANWCCGGTTDGPCAVDQGSTMGRLGVNNWQSHRNRPKTKYTLGRLRNPTTSNPVSTRQSGMGLRTLTPREAPTFIRNGSAPITSLQTQDKACLAYAVRSQMELPSQYLLCRAFQEYACRLLQRYFSTSPQTSFCRRHYQCSLRCV